MPTAQHFTSYFIWMWDLWMLGKCPMISTSCNNMEKVSELQNFTLLSPVWTVEVGYSYCLVFTSFISSLVNDFTSNMNHSISCISGETAFHSRVRMCFTNYNCGYQYSMVVLQVLYSLSSTEVFMQRQQHCGSSLWKIYKVDYFAGNKSATGCK